MSAADIFNFANTFVLPFWLLLIVYPKWQLRNVVIYSAAALLACIYAFYIFTGPSMDFDSFGSLEGVMGLFTVPEAVLVGWIHYLAFDLLMGNWIVNHSRELGIKHLFVIPCLVFCFMLGPVGYLIFTIVKYSKLGRTA